MAEERREEQEGGTAVVAVMVMRVGLAGSSPPCRVPLKGDSGAHEDQAMEPRPLSSTGGLLTNLFRRPGALIHVAIITGGWLRVGA